MGHENKKVSSSIAGNERNHKRIIRELSDEKISDTLNRTKGHQASKWGRRYICQKLSHCESLSRSQRRYIKSKTNKELVELAIRHLAFDDTEFKKLPIKSKSATNLLYYWKLRSQKEKVEEPCVYVIGNHEFIKVGFSKNVTKRLSSIQTGCPYPLKIIKVFKGLDRQAEKVFHRKLEKWNVHGEWFKRCDEVEHILEIKS